MSSAPATSLSGKTIVITGASSGLGEAIALQCAAYNARLVLAARRADALPHIAERCRAAGAEEVIPIPCDVTRYEHCVNLINQASGPGGIDYLVLNAGLSMWAPFDKIQDISLFERLIAVNYLGAVHCTHAALPSLRQRKGLIVAVSSIQGRVGVPLHSGYGAAKHALEGFFASLRTELEGTGVEVLMVLPHWLAGTELRASALGPDGAPMAGARRSHSRDAVPVAEAASAVVRAMQSRRRELIIPGKLRVLFLLQALFPGVARWLIRRKMSQQHASGES